MSSRTTPTVTEAHDNYGMVNPGSEHPDAFKSFIAESMGAVVLSSHFWRPLIADIFAGQLP